MSPRRFAADTTVSVEKSRSEIEAMVTRAGAKSFMSGSSPDQAVIAFEMKDRKVIFYLPLPSQTDKAFRYTPAQKKWRGDAAMHQAWEQACRSRWRALALAIKAKLEAVAIGISEFEEEFLSHIVMPDGLTVAQHVRPRIADAYASGQVTPLLPAPGRPNA